MRSIEIKLFCEDDAHKRFIEALCKRFAQDYHVGITIQPVTYEKQIKDRTGKECRIKGGFGKAVSNFKEFLLNIKRDRDFLPDIILVILDANCHHDERSAKIQNLIKDLPFHHLIIFSLPDPHIERWLLLDQHAFKMVFDRSCRLPDHKCDKDRYKMLLKYEISQTGVISSFGGVEYTEDIVTNMDLNNIQDDVLRQLVGQLRAKIQQLTAH